MKKSLILKPTEENIALCGKALREGKLVAFPTETVYGLGANAFLPEAVARIFEVKERPKFDPLIVHIANMDDIKEIANLGLMDNLQKNLLFKLIENFWPGPLTVVLPKNEKVPRIVTAGLDTVAVRMPSHPVARALIEKAGIPVAAPSANKFSRLSPTRAEHVAAQIGKEIDFIIDAGRTPLGVESTVIDLTHIPPVLLRPGGLPLEQIIETIGPVELSKSTPDEVHPKSPGMLKKHYAPSKPLHLLEDIYNFEPPPGSALLALTEPEPSVRQRYVKVEVLSPKGDLREAASNLFDALHRLENSEAKVIYAQSVPEKGLGRAIMDRLRKAAHS